jgi:hypothetical protein
MFPCEWSAKLFVGFFFALSFSHSPFFILRLLKLMLSPDKLMLGVEFSLRLVKVLTMLASMKLLPD